MQNALDDARAEIARIPELKNAMNAGFAAVKAQLADALANQGDPTAVLAVVKELHDNLDGLAADVAANTTP